MKKFKLIGIVISTLVAVLIPAQAVMAASSQNVTITATPGKVAITLDVTSYSFGTVSKSETWYSTATSGSPTQTDPMPLDDSECFSTITNAGNITIKVSAQMGNMTYSGEATWTSSTAAGIGTFRMDIGASGASSWTGPINTTTEFISSLAASGTKKFALKFATPTDDDSYEGINTKTGTLIISAVKA